MFAGTLGQFWKSQPRVPQVRTGATYRRTRPGNLVETARVLEIGADPMGIAHVRYVVLVYHAAERQSAVEELRTLNLETFAAQFSGPLES